MQQTIQLYVSVNHRAGMLQSITHRPVGVNKD